MSDLKPFNSERIYWAVEQVEREAGDIDDLHLDANLFYLKSEADKVISELELKLARAQMVLRLNEPKALYANLEIMSRLNHKIDVVERRELHQKFKRCLAMAEWCDMSCRELLARAVMHVRQSWTRHDEWRYFTNYWGRNERRWRDLAESLKERL